jgi:hypothetical protein
MKIGLIALLVVLAGVFSGVGLAAFGKAPPESSGALVLLGSGVVGLALWGRSKFRR